MKVIDLLNMISKGEEVPLIKYRDKILHWNKEKDRFENEDGMDTLYEMDFSELNDEVEILEEDKKIKKINKSYSMRKFNDKFEVTGYDAEKIIEMLQDVYKKVDEIIDKINKEDK